MENKTFAEAKKLEQIHVKANMTFTVSWDPNDFSRKPTRKKVLKEVAMELVDYVNDSYWYAHDAKVEVVEVDD